MLNNLDEFTESGVMNEGRILTYVFLVLKLNFFPWNILPPFVMQNISKGQWHTVWGVTCQPKGQRLGSTDRWKALQNFKQGNDRSDLNFYKVEEKGKQKCLFRVGVRPKQAPRSSPSLRFSVSWHFACGPNKQIPNMVQKTAMSKSYAWRQKWNCTKI